MDIIREIESKSIEYFDEQMELLKELTSIDCPTGYIKGNEQVVKILKKALEKMKVEIEEIFDERVGTHLVARIKPENPQGKIIVNAHIDTFTGFKEGDCEAHPFRIDGDWAYGIGITDNKGGVVSSMYSVRILQELGALPNKEIVMIYNCDEETGSPSGRDIFKREAEGTECAYVFEPARDDNGILTARNGIAICTMEITGRTAHATVGYKDGRSASKELAHQALRLFEATDYTNLTVDVSQMQSNKGISDKATARIVAGFNTKEGEESFLKLIEEIQTGAPFVEGCKTTIKIVVQHPEMPRTQANLDLYEHMKHYGKIYGYDYCQEPKSGTGDACLLASYGVPCIDGIGPYMKDIHRTDERMHIPSLTEKTKVFALTLANK